MYRVLCVAFVVLLVLSGVAAAQDNSKVDIFGGYQYTHVSTGVSGAPTFNFNGWDASLSGYFNKYVGISADFSGAYGSPLGASFKIHTFMFGPIVRFTNKSRVTPFAHALFGGVHGSASAGGFGAGETDFSWAAGGGIDVGVNHRFAVRLAQADFLQTRIASLTQNNFRYSAGIVIKF